jgi:hypothetical protein
VLQVNGDNPANVHVGATYTDLGASITGPQADLNLGITTYVNGAPMNPVQLDTSTAATEPSPTSPPTKPASPRRPPARSLSRQQIHPQSSRRCLVNPSNFPFPVAGRAVPYSITSSIAR